MSGHLEQGELRAWLDGELTPGEAASVSAHLKECAPCGTLREELSARASRVANAMSVLALDLPESATLPLARAPRVTAMPRRSAWRRAGPIAALAAGLAIAMFLQPKHQTPSASVVTPKRAAIRTVPSRVTATPVAAAMAKPRKPGVAALAAQKKSLLETFLALDDEPIETGMVVRVSTESGDLQADVIVGPDGRAHAIRIVNGGTDF